MSVALGPAGMVDPQDHLQRAVVRIFNGGRTVVGTGFLVAPDLIATCAHVVNEALQDKGHCVSGGEEVEIQPVSMPDEDNFVCATVEGRYFRDKDAEDVAFLRVKTQLADIAPLTLATSRGLEGRTLRGWGFPKVGPDGLWMTATVIGPLDNQRTGRRMQLSSQEISPGCSGGPLWDAHGRVVGMAVAIIDQEARTTGRHEGGPGRRLSRTVR